jgi:hypothetical protein
VTSAACSYCAGDKRAIDDAALLDHTATTELVWHLANAPINSKNFSSFVHAVIRAEKITLRVPAEQGASASVIEDFISSVNDLRILRFVLDGQHDRWRCLQCGVASHEELTSVYIAASKQLVRHAPLPTARALQISHRSCSCSCCQRLQRKGCSVPAASARQQFTTRTAIFALGNSRNFHTGYTVTVTRSQTLTKAVKRFEEACCYYSCVFRSIWLMRWEAS